MRSYCLPLGSSPSPESQAHRHGLGAVTRMALTHDSALLFAGTSQGMLVVYDVKSKVGLSWSRRVLPSPALDALKRPQGIHGSLVYLFC